MPNVEKDKLSLMKRGDALYVDVGNFRREIALPHVLAGLEPGTARMHAGALEIPFEVLEAETLSRDDRQDAASIDQRRSDGNSAGISRV
jgi:arsenite-transporting ATPase